MKTTNSSRGSRFTSDGVFSNLVDLIYAAATQPQGWPVFLEQLASATTSAITALLLRDGGTEGTDLLWYFGGSEEAARGFAEWAPQNVIMQSAAPFLRSGAVFPNNPVPRTEYLRSAFYSEYLGRFAKVVDAAGVCIAHEPPLSTVLSCHRLISKPDSGRGSSTGC